jgi:hypothetical protein
MRAFIIHLGIFVLVVGVLVAINLYRSPDHIWFTGCLPAGASVLPHMILRSCYSAPAGAKRSLPTRESGPFSFISSSMSR